MASDRPPRRRVRRSTRRRHAKRRRRRSFQADPHQGATTCAGPPERGGPGGSRAERLTHLAMPSVWALGSVTSGRSGAGKPRRASIGCRAGDSGNLSGQFRYGSAQLKHSKLGSGRHQRLLLLPREAQHLLWLRATTRKYVTITG